MASKDVRDHFVFQYEPGDVAVGGVLFIVELFQEICYKLGFFLAEYEAEASLVQLGLHPLHYLITHINKLTVRNQQVTHRLPIIPPGLYLLMHGINNLKSSFHILTPVFRICVIYFLLIFCRNRLKEADVSRKLLVVLLV